MSRLLLTTSTFLLALGLAAAQTGSGTPGSAGTSGSGTSTGTTQTSPTTTTTPSQTTSPTTPSGTMTPSTPSTTPAQTTPSQTPSTTTNPAGGTPTMTPGMPSPTVAGPCDTSGTSTSSTDVQPKYEFQHQLDEQHHPYEPDSRGSVCARRHEQTAHWCHYYSEYNTSPNDSATPVLKSDGHEHRKKGAVLPLSTFCKAQTWIVSLERSIAVGQPSAIVKSGESR